MTGVRLAINKLFYTQEGQFITSALFGLAFAFLFKKVLFKKVCKDNCTIYYAPHVEEVDHKIFKLEDTCYKYTPYMVKCDNEVDILQPYDSNNKPLNKIDTNKYKSNISNN
jgi:hypothetical protein